MSKHSIPQEFASWYDQVGKWDRAIVARRVGIYGGAGTLLTIVAAVLHSYGVPIPDGLPDQVTLIVTGGLNAAALLGSVLWAQHGTTPADPALKPTASNGEPLVTLSAAVAAAGRPVLAAVDPAIAALAAAAAIHPA